MKQKILALSLITLLACSVFFGCGNKKVDPQATGTTSSTESAVLTSSEYEVSSDEQTDEVSSDEQSAENTSNKQTTVKTSLKENKTEKEDYSFTLKDNSYCDKKKLTMNDNRLTVDLTLPKDGIIDLNADFDEGYIKPRIFLGTIKDANGKTLYKDIDLVGKPIKKTSLSAGKVSLVIDFKGKKKLSNKVILRWAYVPKETKTPKLEARSKSKCMTEVKNGKAEFDISLTEDSLIEIMPYTSDVDWNDWVPTFHIVNSEGERVTDDLSTSFNDYTTREVFLPKGDYTIVITDDIYTIATCKIVAIQTYSNINLGNPPANSLLPVIFGFTKLTDSTRTMKINNYGGTHLRIEAYGQGNYYDSNQVVNVKLTDSTGKVIIKEETDLDGDDTHFFALPKQSGEYTLEISTKGTAVVIVDFDL